MRIDVAVWAAAALLLMAAEAVAPGAFLLWMGFAAAAVFLATLFIPGIPILAQVAAFVILSFVSIQVYRKLIRGKGRERQSDNPTLNRRAAQHVGRVITLDRAIVSGAGRAKIGDAFWVVQGPDLPAGTQVQVLETDGSNLVVEPTRPDRRSQGDR